MILATGVTVRVGQKDLVKDIDFVAPAGKFTAIIGPNGAGKSTFLKVLSGENTAAQGVVQVLGQDINHWSRESIARVRAVLPQSTSLNFAFQVRDVVRLGRLPFGEDKRGVSDCEAIVSQALADVGLSGFEQRLYTELSGGEQRRVQFARVLTQIDDAATSGSGILLLDEPTSNLDPAHAFSVLRLSHRLSRQGLTVIAVVHDVNIAAAYADYFVGMNDGRIAFSGETKDVLTVDNLEGIYGIKTMVYPHPGMDCLQVSFLES